MMDTPKNLFSWELWLKSKICTGRNEKCQISYTDHTLESTYTPIKNIIYSPFCQFLHRKVCGILQLC